MVVEAEGQGIALQSHRLYGWGGGRGAFDLTQEPLWSDAVPDVTSPPPPAGRPAPVSWRATARAPPPLTPPPSRCSP